MPIKIKNIISLIVLFLISQSLLGDIRLRAPFPNNNYNHYKGVHVSCISDEFNSRHSKVSITGHNETYYSKMVNYNHHTQVNTQAYSPYSPFKEAKYRNVGTGYNDFVLPMDFSMKNAVIQRHSSEMPSKTHNLLISSRHYTFRLLGNGLVDDAIIQSNSSGIPSENTESMKVSGRKNAFAPPTEGMPINDAILPLLIFSFIYLIVKHILKIKAQRI